MEHTSEVSRLPIYQQYVEAYGIKSNKELSEMKGTDRDWTPYRFCSGDWLLSVAVARCSRQRYEVALFVTAEHWMFEKQGGLKAALSFLLADAFHRTGKMEIFFRGPRHGERNSLEGGFEPKVPESIRGYADSVGVRLSDAHRISDEQGRLLYQKLARFSDRLGVLLSERSVDANRAAFLVHRGVWTPLSLAYLVAYCADPNLILQGAIAPENWLEFKRELIVLRKALLAERIASMLDATNDAQGLFTFSWEESQLGWQLNLRSSAEVSLADAFGNQFLLEKEISLPVILAPFSAAELSFKLSTLLNSVAVLPRKIIAVTKDLDWLSSGDKARLETSSNGTTFLRVFDIADELDAEILERLRRAATTRVDVEERTE